MIYLIGGFSLSLLPESKANLSVVKMTPKEVAELLVNSDSTCNGVTSAEITFGKSYHRQIGIRNENLFNVVKSTLASIGRIEFVEQDDSRAMPSTLVDGDTLIVVQLSGGRLPEGVTSLPDGYSLTFYKIQLMGEVKELLDPRRSYTERKLKELGFKSLRGLHYKHPITLEEAYGYVEGCGECTYCEAEATDGNCTNCTIIYKKVTGAKLFNKNSFFNS